MPIDKAMETLVRLGLVIELPTDDGSSVIGLPCSEAYEILKSRWDGLLEHETEQGRWTHAWWWYIGRWTQIHGDGPMVYNTYSFAVQADETCTLVVLCSWSEVECSAETIVAVNRIEEVLVLCAAWRVGKAEARRMRWVWDEIELSLIGGSTSNIEV